MVAAVQTLEDLFPGIKLPPDRLVKRGGYWNVQEGVDDILGRLRDFWSSRSKKVRGANEQGTGQSIRRQGR